MALNDMTLTRREMLKGAGGLLFVVGAGGLASVADAGGETARATDALAWVRIDPEGAIRILFPATEMGQGSSTALPLILAEELDADWDDVVIEQLNRDDRRFGNPAFGNVLYTAGSSAVYGYFDALRQAGADARAVLMQRAAALWQLPVSELRTEPSAVVHDPSGRRAAYGTLANGAGPLAIGDRPAPLKDPADYRLIGSATPRRDVPGKTDGTETFAIDVRVPGMLYASVLRAPVEGETLVSMDTAEARAAAGVVEVVSLPDGVAVVAETPWAARRGRDRLSVTWTETAAARDWSDAAALEVYAAAAEDLTSESAVWRVEGDAAAAIAAADRTMSATYRSDYAYHAQMEPMAVVADVAEDGSRAEVWAGTQTQSWTQRTIAEVLGIGADAVTLHMMPMGGGFGRRTALTQEYVRDALLCSRATGRPVKAIWTREDDLKHGWFRPAAAQHLRAGLNAQGGLSGWQHRVATPSVIAYFNPLRWQQVAPQDIISMRGAESKFYAIPDFAAEHVITERMARVIPWRGIGAAYTSFAAEAFVDELAEAAGRDPFAFRARLMSENPRGRHLLERVRAMSDWDRRHPGTGRGLAFAGYGDTMAAGVAEISLDRDSGVIRVLSFWAAVDAGLLVSPGNARAQVEGGIVFGVSSALRERVTIERGQVQQENFYDYEILRADAVPDIDVYFATGTHRPTQVGEAGTPMVAAAIANAFHDLTGRRLRHMPFTPERVREALGA